MQQPNNTLGRVATVISIVADILTIYSILTKKVPGIPKKQQSLLGLVLLCFAEIVTTVVAHVYWLPQIPKEVLNARLMVIFTVPNLYWLVRYEDIGKPKPISLVATAILMAVVPVWVTTVFLLAYNLR